MNTKIAASYDHNSYEKKWWNHWIKGGWFHGRTDSQKTPYSIIIPPPNVTDRLHMGHGLNNTIQDILIRWKRMQGYNTCWVPGTDHAGISTQMMVEKSLEEEGVTRVQLGRDKFFRRCMQWKEDKGGIIIEQLKRLGASCDWDREAYTMDPQLSQAVRKIFVELYEEGLIYRGERLVNWDPTLKTAISDDEVESKEVAGNLWYLRYPIVGRKDENGDDDSLTVATTRPETLLGDTAVAVNPDDERFQGLIGEYVIIPLVNRKVPIIADPYVKSEFGTGCVKITPAHDPNDFAIGKRHNLPFINVMNDDGTMNDVCPEEFRGLDRFEARKLIVRRFKEMDLFEKIENIKHSVPYSDRSKAPIEPRLSKQWYVSMKPLAEPAIAAAKKDKLRFYPDTWKKTYLYWLENVQDWCISRQLWWGHRIPIWYCEDCDEITTGMTDPTECKHCQSPKIKQDEDVLDTWFSSWLWPVSPLGWPKDTADLERFFPSNVLVTGPDIIYLWVARMIMAGYFTKGKLAFKDVYFNAIICDKDGRKFSKTLGNGIDPLPLIERFGADAVRYTCVSLAPLGGRVKMAVSDFDNGNRFINKLWNAYRFLMQYVKEGEKLPPLDLQKIDLPNTWLLHELHSASAQINTHLTSYHVNEAVETLFHLAWRGFCDWGLETAKETLESGSQEERLKQLSVLVYVFDGIMRLASPVIPFISEEIWQSLPSHPDWDRPESLVVASFPDPAKLPAFPTQSAQWAEVQNLIGAVRSIRTQAGVPPKEFLPISLQCDAGIARVIDENLGLIKRLAKVSDMTAGPSVTRPAQSLVAAGKGWTVFVPVGEYLDFGKERKRLETEVGRIAKIVDGLQAKLGNPNFADRAPRDVVESTEAQLQNMRGQLSSLKENLATMTESP